MSKTVKLLLTESVEALGIVGDVVTVRTGYARNFLMPRNLVTTPSEEKIAALAVKRAEAEKQLALIRAEKEKLIERLEGVEVSIERACNDLGMLYGSVTQQDIAAALVAAGFGVKARDVRINQTIKRVDTYDVPVKLASDLEADVKVHVKSDRPLEMHKHQEADAAAAAAAAAAKAAKSAEAPADGAPAEAGTVEKKGKKSAKAAEEAPAAEEPKKEKKASKKAKAEA